MKPELSPEIRARVDKLARKYTIRYCEDLLRACPDGANRLYAISQQHAVHTPRPRGRK